MDRGIRYHKAARCGAPGQSIRKPYPAILAWIPAKIYAFLNHDLAEVTDMNTAWLYLDKRNAVIHALKDYESMHHIIQTAPAEMTAAQDRMTGIGSPALSGMPKGPHDPHAAEKSNR